jgi:hypothetical protein
MPRLSYFFLSQKSVFVKPRTTHVFNKQTAFISEKCKLSVYSLLREMFKNFKELVTPLGDFICLCFGTSLYIGLMDVPAHVQGGAQSFKVFAKNTYI